MIEYDVKFIFDYCYIGVVVVADDEEQAISQADLILAQTGINYPDPNETYVEQTGEYL